MRNSKLKNKISVVFILFIFLGSLLLLAGALQFTDGWLSRASAEVNITVSKEISDEYAFGDKFVVPDCTFVKDGKTAKGVASLQFPDDTQTNKGEVTLNQSGKYALKYIATLDGKVYTKEYGFIVKGRLASYNSEKTSMEYGLCTHLGANSTGLTVKIANGDSLTFDHVFDMSEMTMATKLLEGFVVPTVQGTVDFTKMVFTFTDVEDPSVQLVYHGNFHDDSNAYGLTFFTAAGNGQIHCGLEHVGKLHVGSTLGCMVPHSFMAMDTGLYYGAQAAVPAAPDSKTFCISYDAESNQAWAGGKIISDLDDSNYYNTLWFGFPSGKAKLTVSALNYTDATASICFTSILGVDLSAENYVDEEAPIITVDNDYEVMPDAMVGGTYPVPSASAIDLVSGTCDVNVSVWHNYGEADQKMVNIENGRFKVESVGTYAIVYEAIDYSGNVGRTVLWVRAYLSQYFTKLSVEIDGDYATEVEVGTLQRLPNVTVNGGSGEHTVVYTLTKGKEECAINDGTFRLEQAGEWVLTCTATDYVGNTAVDVCALNGVISGKPIIIDEPTFPAAYVSGSSYTLSALYAYDYSSGVKEQKLCDVSVEYGENRTSYSAGDLFTPTVDNDKDTVNIVYSCDGEVLLEKEIPVLIVLGKERIPGDTERYRDVVNVEKYFYTDDDLTFTNKYELSGITGLKITANQNAESVKTVFANPQLADSFSLDLMTVPTEARFSQLNVTLVDSVDNSISVKASLIKGDEQTLMVVGDTVLTLTLNFEGATAEAYNIGFKDGKFIVNETTSISVSKTDEGEAFNGFPSGKVYFEIEMCDVSANASVFLSKICKINVSNTQDNTGPFMTTPETIVANVFKDSVYTVQRVIVCDVLCANSSAYLTVLAPDGTVVTSIDGILLENVDATRDYQIEMSAYGNYNVAIVATEADTWKYSNSSYLDYAITVTDGEAPTIEFKENFKTTLKVGDTLTIPPYTVSDNYSSAEKISVLTTIVNPKGMPIYLYGDSNAIRCEYAGIYQIKIYVYDEMGNLTVYETSVTVE